MTNKLSRDQVLEKFGKPAGAKAINKVDRLRPVSTGIVFDDNSREYVAAATLNFESQNSIILSVYYSIPPGELPSDGVFKIRPPILVPIGYSFASA